MFDETAKNKIIEGEIELSTAQPSTARGTTPSPTDLVRIAADPELTEDLAMSVLKRTDLPPEVLEEFAKNVGVLKSRKVKIAIASHPRTPRHVSVPLSRQFYTFELMKVALAATVPADVKIAVDDVLIARLKTVTTGECLTLARRASGRVAAALLLDVPVIREKLDAQAVARETRVMRTALENPRLTETLLINAVLRPLASAALVDAVAQHRKWSLRREIRAALLRTPHLSLARALEFSREIPRPLLPELLASSHLPEQIKTQLLRENEMGKTV
jgi:hypothetical protein